MRHGRAKTARRTLKFYHLNGGITPPYKVLLDGNFIVESIRRKIPIRERLENILHTPKFTFYITRSILNELDSLPSNNNDDVIAAARRFARSDCHLVAPSDISPTDKDDDDDEDDHSASTDLQSLLIPANPHRYLLATQDADLSSTLRNQPNVPLLRINQTVLLLESISAASRSWAQRNEAAKVADGISETERDLAMRLRKKRGREEREARRVERRREAMEVRRGVGRDKPKAKEPNSVSGKKKRGVEEGPKKKRRRRRKGTAEGSG